MICKNCKYFEEANWGLHPTFCKYYGSESIEDPFQKACSHYDDFNYGDLNGNLSSCCKTCQYSSSYKSFSNELACDNKKQNHFPVKTGGRCDLFSPRESKPNNSNDDKDLNVFSC